MSRYTELADEAERLSRSVEAIRTMPETVFMLTMAAAALREADQELCKAREPLTDEQIEEWSRSFVGDELNMQPAAYESGADAFIAACDAARRSYVDGMKNARDHYEAQNESGRE